MMTTSARTVRVAADIAFEWGRCAAEAATRVPAAGDEAVNWTVRGWAEVALGCVVGDLPEAFRGLDEIVRTAGVPCAGPFAVRLRALRRLGGDLPDGYGGDERGLSSPAVLPHAVARAAERVAQYCDALDDAASAAVRRRGPAQDRLPIWTTTADQLRWGERFRPAPHARQYAVLNTSVGADLVRRSWMRLPGADAPRIVQVSPSDVPAATVRQRIRQGIHNGAHLDHLTAFSAAAAGLPWQPAAIEFGGGLVAAEAYAMSVELLASAECLLAGAPAEARQIHRGLVSRIGRIPGYRAWYARRGHGPRALAEAAEDRVDEFATLPTLSAQYVAGPLRLIADNWCDPLVPAALAENARRRWAAVCARFEPAAALTDAARRDV